VRATTLKDKTMKITLAKMRSMRSGYRIYFGGQPSLSSICTLELQDKDRAGEISCSSQRVAASGAMLLASALSLASAMLIKWQSGDSISGVLDGMTYEEEN
jgi:hypothetical protein